ncbi:hypothetical protein EDM80_07195 [bacterium]|nr:MAG: hypothetical protein EDM80_07195 [bacterium]RIK65404.1 MAG: hypothetical protein DCC64_01845 [Planctomycetota bacterium]
MPESLIVRQVKPGSPADIAGVMETDCLVEFCGVEVRDVAHLIELQRQHERDSEVTWVFHTSNGVFVAVGSGRKTVVAPPGSIGVTFK